MKRRRIDKRINKMKKYSFYFKESKPFVKLMMLICIFMVFTSIASFILSITSLPSLASQALSQIIMFGMAPLLWSLMFEGTTYKNISFQNKNIKYYILIAIGLLIVSMPLIDGINIWNNSWHFQGEESFRLMEENAQRVMEKFMQDTSTSNLILNIIVLALIPALLEEYFFRVALQTSMINLFRNKFIGIFLTSILFSLIHFQLFSFFPRVIMGIFLGYLYVLSKNVVVPIVYHFFNNLIIVMGYYLFNTKIIETNLIQTGYIYTPILFALSLILTTGLYFFAIRINRKEN
ncbi:MAG: family intrarane metalloprotease [Bacteroidetes bacterium]|nr:family intrarane metalloprotease [Bacteroidota bacterium]